MFEIVLHQPEIPPNTGNVIRLCANTGCGLHLVRPLGFSIRNKELLRSGLDHHERVAIAVHDDWSGCRKHLVNRRAFALTTQGTIRHDQPNYAPGDVFVFGSETSGLPEAVLEEFAPAMRLRIPLREGSRSLNLSNAVAIAVYEAWRQCGFTGQRPDMRPSPTAGGDPAG